MLQDFNKRYYGATYWPPDYRLVEI